MAEIIKVGELKKFLEPWNDEAEVWVLDRHSRMSPVEGAGTFGPDSTERADGVVLTTHRKDESTMDVVVREVGLAACSRILGLTQRTPICCAENAVINYGLCSTCLQAARRTVEHVG